ncbi:MAG: hypothetical protein ACE5J5_08010, partial [Candidatus Hydrothermarchaeales archaeon]
MRKFQWIFVLIIVLFICSFSVNSVFAGPAADNSLDLNVHNKGENVGISFFTGYRPQTESYRATLRLGGANTEITIDASINKSIVNSWLYIYTGGYDSETFSTIRVNGNIVSGNEHLIPVGEDKKRWLDLPGGVHA